MRAKLYTGGGDGIDHSSVAPSHGSSEASSPLRRLLNRLITNSNTENPMPIAPIVEIWFSSVTPSSGPYVYTRRGMPSNPVQCMGMKVRLKKMTNVQKFHLPRVSLIIRPLIFGKYS